MSKTVLFGVALASVVWFLRQRQALAEIESIGGPLTVEDEMRREMLEKSSRIAGATLAITAGVWALGKSG